MKNKKKEKHKVAHIRISTIGIS